MKLIRVILLGLVFCIFNSRASAATPAISAGISHSLFLKSDGTVWATGGNSNGQLGNGTTTNLSIPVQVMSGVSAISAGSFHSLFLKSDGTVWATGSNIYGKLGDGSTTSRRTPVQVMSGVTAISAGGSHSLFLKSDGTVWAAGFNGYGQLGNGTTTNRSTPVQVMSGVSAISAGDLHSLFLKSDGTVWATGANYYGQLGNGTRTDLSIPVQVVSGVSAISAGDVHSLFLKSDGTVWATGRNTSGQLGNGTTTDLSIPVQVVSGVSAISAGSSHSLFLKSDGTVWASGSNSSGQLGDGTPTSRSTPVQVMSGVSAISARGHSLFLKSDGTVWAAGNNFYGQLGNGTTTDLSTPVQTLLSLGPISPLITTQPQSIATVVSAIKSLSVNVAAIGAITYQWQLNGLVIPGATNATYSIASVQFSDAGSYTCVVSNGYVSVVSETATLTVYTEASLTIRTQPTPKVIPAGNSATFSLTATSIEPIGYQWRKNGVAIAGATSSSYTIPAVTTSDAGSYSCIVSDYDELLLSSSATLTVQTAPPAISSQPASLIVTQNSSAVFSVTATGIPAPAYQWRLNGTPITGAVSASYSIASAQEVNAGDYTCVVTNAAGSVTSSVASLTVQIPPSILTHPTSRTVLQNAFAPFRVIATGIPAPIYQWQFNGSDISGATSASYNIASAQAANAGDYTCVVTNAAGSVTSSIATLTVNIPATVTAQPSSQAVNPASSATFSVTATGTGTLSYQWRKNGREIAGATASTLTLTDVRFLDEAKYTCVVSNVFGTVLSTSATLTITISPTSPDSDGDGISDALETYLSVFGLDPAVDSTEEWSRLLAMIPELGAYYTADQMRDLAVGSPTLQRGANGNFLLDVTVQESTDLNTWTKRTLTAPMLTYPGGVLRLELPPLDSSTRFYRLRSQPAP